MIGDNMLNKINLGGKDIDLYKNFVSEEDAKALITFYNSYSDRWMPICFYNSFGMGVSEPVTKEHGTHISDEYINSLKDRLIETVSFSAGKEVKINSIHAQKWEVGAYANDHSDNSDLDGTPSGWNDNKYACILYLNTDFEGGELKFRDHNIAIKPDLGDLIVFPGGMENVHSVPVITSGVRYTIVAFWDFADVVYTEEEMEWRKNNIAQERLRQAKMKAEWAKGIDNPIIENPYDPNLTEEQKVYYSEN
jgi:hypothetical protein